MEKQDIQELAETTYGLIVVLKDILWKFEGFSKDNQRKFTGMLALIDIIEQQLLHKRHIIIDTICLPEPIYDALDGLNIVH